MRIIFLFVLMSGCLAMNHQVSDKEVEPVNPDQDCLQVWYKDSDSDGFGDPSGSIKGCEQLSCYVANAEDCNDTSGLMAPNTNELCDAVDNDCDGEIDEGCV